MDSNARDLGYYKRLPYSLRTEMVRDSDGAEYWIAEYVELRGCKTDGSSEAEAVENLQELFDDYIGTVLDQKGAIPEPAQLPEVAPLVWIVAPAGNLHSELPQFDAEGTRETGGEVRPETYSTNFQEIAA